MSSTLLQEMLRNIRLRQNEQQSRQDYDNLINVMNDYQNNMSEYQRNMTEYHKLMNTYLLLLTSLQIQISSSRLEMELPQPQTQPQTRTTNRPSTSRINQTYTTSSFPTNGNIRTDHGTRPPYYQTNLVSESIPFSTTDDTRRLFDSLLSDNQRNNQRNTWDISGNRISSGSRVHSEPQTSPTLIDIILEYDEDQIQGVTNSQGDNTALQRIINSDDFRNSILRAAGIENQETVRRWVMNPQNSEEERGLTLEEIRNVTISLIFSETTEGLLSTTCPITMEEFIPGDRLLQLRTCQHAFRERELVEWFHRERTCPVCRTNYGSRVRENDY